MHKCTSKKHYIFYFTSYSALFHNVIFFGHSDLSLENLDLPELWSKVMCGLFCIDLMYESRALERLHDIDCCLHQ